MANVREIPPVKYDKDVNRLVSYYQSAHLQVVNELIRLLENDNFNQFTAQEAALARQLQLIILANDKVVLPEVQALIEKSFVAGQAQALLSLGMATTLAEATQGVSMSLLAQKSVEKMVTDTFEDVLALTDRTNKKIKQEVRDIAGEVMRMNAIQQLGLDTTRKQIMQKMLKKNFSTKIVKDFKGVTSSDGRKWEMKTYVNMLTKTKMQQAYSEGVRSESIERGTDLAMISSHGAEDACRHFEGMVISLTGATKGLYTLDELKKSNKIFHPNCEHTITPLRSLDLLPPQLREKHEKLLANAKSSKII